MIELIKLSQGDRMICEKLRAYFPDEFAVRGAAYHIQQATEKLLKAYILFGGQTPGFTHDISALCEHAQKLDLHIPDDLMLIADTLTLWESKSRYDPYVSFTEQKYKMAVDSYDDLYEHLIAQIHAFGCDEPEL